MRHWLEKIKQKCKPFWDEYGFMMDIVPFLAVALIFAFSGPRRFLMELLSKIELSRRGETAVIFAMILAAWGGIGLLFGRSVACWFPFLPTSRIYLLIPGRFLPRLLIGAETMYWGRTGPKGLPEEYYRVSPKNRNKMCLWGVLFYAGWLALFILMMVSGQLPDPLGDWIYPLFLVWPVLLHGLGNWDYSRGFHRLAEKEKQRDKEE